MFERTRAKIKFENLLSFIYRVSTASGFVFVSNDSKSYGQNYKFRDFTVFVVSFAFSIFSYTYDAHVAIAKITQSRLTELGVNGTSRLVVWLPLLLKILNLIQTQKFVRVLKNLQWCHGKVRAHLAEATHRLSLLFAV